MSLYMPSRLPANAAPPLRYPPLLSDALPAYRRGVYIIAVGTLAALAGDHLPLWLFMALNAGLGFCFISSAVLRRELPTQSRYGTSRELIKLLASVPCVLWASAPQTGLASSLQDPARRALYFLAFVTGLHWIFLDGLPLLQSLGCKVPVPSRWHTLVVSELGVLALCAAVAGALLLRVVIVVSGFGASASTSASASTGAVHSAHGAWAARVVAAYGMTLLPLAAMAWARRHTHNVHFHHYCMAAVAMPLVAHPAITLDLPLFPLLPLLPLPLGGPLLHGAAFGAYVEGIATWGMDPVLVRTSTSASASATTNLSMCDGDGEGEGRAVDASTSTNKGNSVSTRRHECALLGAGLQRRWFLAVSAGRKVVEGRLGNHRLAGVQRGDRIAFYDVGAGCTAGGSTTSASTAVEAASEVEVEVACVVRYPTFRKMIETEGLGTVLPDVTRVADGVAIYRAFYTPAAERKHGVVAIHFTRLHQ